MVIVAWTALGLASGLLARGLLPGRAKGFIITCVTGICGALIGSWTAASLPHMQTLPGFSRLSALAAGSPGLPAASPALPPANGT